MQKLLRLPAHSDGRCHIRVAFDRWNRNCLLKPTMDTRFASFWTDRLTFFCLFDRATRVVCGFSAGFYAGWKIYTDLICVCRVSATYLRCAGTRAEADRKRMVLSTIHVSQAHIFEKQSRCRESGSSVSTVVPVPGFFLFCILCTILLLLHSYKCS